MITWDDMDAAADSILKYQSMQQRLLSATPETDSAAAALPAALATIREISILAGYAKTREWRTLQQNLLGFAECKATNPVDQVKSLINISYALFSVNDIPGSDVTVQDAYTQFTNISMKRDQELLALHAAGVGWSCQMEQLPSWVPDYTMNHRRAYHNGRIMILGRLAITARYRSWNFLLSERPAKVVLKQHHPHMITLFGITLNIIIRILEPPALKGGIWATIVQGSVEERGKLIRWFNCLNSLFFKPRQPLNQPYRNPYRKATRPTALEAIIYSLIGGLALWNSPGFGGYNNCPTACWAPGRRPYIDPVWGYESFLALLLRLSLDPALSNVWETFSDSDSGRAAELFCSALDNFSDWSMFETQEGLLGRGPPGARAGDVVCVFEGARTPMLLRRPCSRFVHALTLWSGFQFVGEAYVEGLMERETELLPSWRRRYLHLV